jgi:hypothetical protein
MNDTTKKYQIYSWDVILANSTNRVPIIYVKPDLDFLNLIQSNNYILKVLITDSNSIYDNKIIIGEVNKSSAVPNCRPNFFNDTGLYVVILYCDWNGYPNTQTLGNASFYNNV